MFCAWSLQSASAAQSPQIPIAGSAIPQFMQPLPTLSLAPQNSTMQTIFGNQPLALRMCEFQSKVLPPGTFAAGVQPTTWVWGYLVDPTGTNTCAQLISLYGDANGVLDTYIGPVIVSQRNAGSTNVTWVNDLGNAATTNVLAYKYSTDQTLHWADPLNLGCMMSLMGMPPAFGSPCAENYLGPVPAVVHLHGGEVPAEIDGPPDSWWTSDGAYYGHKYYTFGTPLPNEAIYKYPNMQEAAPIWFHDHTLGATRLNVYAGMAGAYYIQDPGLGLPANLQPLNKVIPLVLQDRMFDTNGQLFYQSDSAGGILWVTNAEHPYWTPEFVGDTIVVNGKAWPYINLEPKRYRFLFLNGSNARTYELSIPGGPVMYVISTDGGYLDKPAMVTKLVMQPGERYEVIIDFAKAKGKNLILSNTARTPFPKGAPPMGSTLGRIVQFRVSKAAVVDNSFNPGAAGAVIRTNVNQQIVRLADPVAGTLAAGVTAAKTRQVTLNEVMGMPMNVIDPVTGVMTAYPGGPLEILVNNTKWMGVEPGGVPRADFTPITVNGVTTYYSELPQEGDTEVWEIVNLTADAHPIHLHLVQFQIINRQNFNVSNYNKAYAAAFGTGPAPLPAGCVAGTFCPAYGPPMNYNTVQNCSVTYPNVVGGNPCVDLYLQGMAQPPLTNEAGWKDTVVTYPGQVTRIAVRWAPTDIPTNALASSLYYPFAPTGDNHLFNYVWHCHIIDHEDNEMMRPDVLNLNPFAPAPSGRPLVKGTDY